MSAAPRNAPSIVQKRAIDVTPYEHGIWCSIADGEPFVNPIVLRQWSEDGTKIHVMLDSHNFDSWDPDDMVNIVEYREAYMSDEELARLLARDRADMARRPVLTAEEQALVLAIRALPREARNRVLERGSREHD